MLIFDIFEPWLLYYTLFLNLGKILFIPLLPFNVTWNISSTCNSWKCILLLWLFDSKSFQFLEIA